MWLLILIRDTPWLARAIDHPIPLHLYHSIIVITSSFQHKSFPFRRCDFRLWYPTIKRKTLGAFYRRKLILLLNSTIVNIEFSYFDRYCHEMLLFSRCHLVIRGLFAGYNGLCHWLLIFIKHILHLQKWPIRREVLTAQITILR